MNNWDKNQFVSAPITSRANAGWVGWKPGRYKAVLRSQSQGLANKGYSWKDLGDIVSAGLQGGATGWARMNKAFNYPIKKVKDVVNRKLDLNFPVYSTPPPAYNQGNQVKQAKIKEQYMTYQEVCNALRGERMKKEAGMRKEALTSIGKFNPAALIKLTKALKTKTNPLGQAFMRAAKTQEIPSFISRNGSINMENAVLNKLLNMFDKRGENFMRLLSDRALANPRRYGPAEGLVSTLFDTPNVVESTKALSKRTGVPYQALAYILKKPEF